MQLNSVLGGEFHMKKNASNHCATAHNSTYVHRRPFGAARATRRCGAPLRHMAPRPGWARGPVTYVRFVMRNYAESVQDTDNTLPRDIGITGSIARLYRFLLYTAFGSMVTRPPSASRDRTSRSIDTDGSPASIFATLDWLD